MLQRHNYSEFGMWPRS